MLRKIRKNYKRLVAFLLSAAMIITNVGGNAGTVFAAESQEERESSIFMVDGQEILEAVGELGDQEALDKEALEELGLALGQKGAIKKYEKLFLPEEGKVYELTLKIDLDLALEGTALQVFYNTKTKEVIFLYQNESGQAVDCCVNIDGYETKVVTVEANEANVSTEEGPISEEENGETPDGNGAGGSSGGSGSGGSGSGSGESSSGGSNGGSGESSEDASGGSGDESSGGQSDDFGDESPEDGTGKEAIGEESKEDASSEEPAEKDGGEDNQDKNSEGKNSGEDSKADEDGETKGSGKEESKADGAEDDGKEESKADGAKDEGKEESRADDSKDNAKEESKADDGKDSAKEETKAEENGNRNDQPGKETDGGKQEEGKPDHGASGKDEENGDGSSKAEGAGKEENSDKEEDGNGLKDEEKPDKGDSKEEGVDQENKDAADKEDSGETSDDKGVKENSGKASDDKGVKEGSGNKSDDQGEKENVSGGSDDRDSGERRRENTPSLSLSRHQAVAVAINLDEVREGEGAEEDRAKETDEEETEEKTTAKAEAVTEEEGEKEEKENSDKTSEPAVEVETVGEAADEEMKAGTTEAAEQEAKDETVEAAGKETKAEISETAEEEAKAEPEKTIEKVTEAEGAKKESEAKDEAEGTEVKSADSTSSTDENESKPAEEGEEEASKEEVFKEKASAEESDNQGGSDRFSEGSSGADSQEITDDWEIPGRIYDTITIRETVNARAYCVALEDVQRIVEANQGAEAVSNEFQVSYRVNPAKAAEVKGDQLVAEGESLCFGVEPKEGYELAAVYANGDELEASDAASLADSSAWDGYTYVYQVEEVAQALDIEIELEEVALAAQAAVYTAETDDAEFTVNVPDGAFTEEVTLRVAKIEDEKQLSDLADQAEAALEKQQTVSSLLAYDISFISQSTGKEVEPAEAVSVSIRVKEPIAAEQKAKSEEKEATGVSVVHLPEDGKAEVVAATENVQETNFEFEAESFSIFVVATVAEAEGTAIVGDKRFDTLQAAIDAVDGENDIIYLLHDVVENIESEDKSYTLEMNQKKITSATAGKIVYTIKGGNVFIKNGTIEGGRIPQGTIKDGKGIKVSGAANVELENCCIKDNQGYLLGGGIYAEGGSRLTLVDSSVMDNYASSNGGGIYASDSEVIIQGSSRVSGNIANGSGDGISCGICIKGGSLAICGSSEEEKVEICNNIVQSTSSKANGIYLENCSVEVENAKFENSGYRGFEINNKIQQDISFKSVEFSGNKVNHALYVDNSKGTLIAENCKFIGNHVKYVENTRANNKGKSTSIPKGVIQFAPGGEKHLKNCEFLNNSMTNSNSSYATKNFSGAICIDGKTGTSSEVTIENCQFVGNHGRHGALYATYATLEIKDSLFKENVGTNTGAIYIAASGYVTALNTTIKENIGTMYGGVNVGGGSFTMSSGALYNNFTENGNPSDVRCYATVDILATSDMCDGEVSFKDYIWKTDGGKGKENTGKLVESDWNNWYVSHKEPELPPVAQIGEKTYKTLKEALDAATKEGTTIKLLAEEVPVDQTIMINKKIVIDMNGCKLKNAGLGISSKFINIDSGGELTLTGESGEVEDYIQVGLNGVLHIKGNIRINTKSSECPIKSYGTVILEHDIDELKIDVWAGKFTVTEDVNISGTLNVIMEQGFNSSSDRDKEVVINGSVKNLILKQGIRQSKSRATVNAKVEAFELKHTNGAYNSGQGQSAKIPATYAGESFSAASIKLIPIIGNGNPSYTELVDLTAEGKSVPDIIMLQSVTGGKIDENQIDLDNVTWVYPGESDAKEHYALVYYLIKPVISDNGSLVLRKFAPDDIGGIYLGGEKGDDVNNHGASPEAPVATFAKAKELSKETGKPIYIVGAVKVRETETWTFADLEEIEGGVSEAKASSKTEETKEKYKLQRYKEYSGELVRVESTGKLTLSNIIIDGKGADPRHPMIGGDVDATAPIIVNQGTLDIESGTVLQNNKNVYTNLAQNSSRTQFEGGAVWNSGELNMTGGVITGNSAVSGAGVFTEGTFNFGGDAAISENTGVIAGKSGKELLHEDDRGKTSPSAGGGVFIAYSRGTMVMSGGMISGNSAAAGGGISIGNHNDWYDGGTLLMTGGTIKENTATNTGVFANDFAGGGGIYVQMGGTADISGGKIIKNLSQGGMFGGGGIYVNGGKKQDRKNGVLRLTEVKVSSNEAKGTGGGIAACDTSNVNIYLTDGGIIWGNTGSTIPYDIYYSPNTPNGIASGKIEISSYMLGGALYQWKTVENPESPAICRYSAASETAVKKAEDERKLVKVWITDNESWSKGGGIGTNGDVYIGRDSDEETIDIKVVKKWKSDTESTEYMTKDELGMPGGVNETFIHEGIKIVLRAKLENEGDDAWKEIKSATLKPFQQGNAQWGEWGEITFTKLLERDVNGNKWVYDIVEAEDDRFEMIGKPVSEPNYDKEGNLVSYTFTLTNIPTCSLKVSKEVPNFGKYPEYNDDSFKFLITLKHKDGRLYTFDELAALKVKNQESGKEILLPSENIKENGIAIELKAGESIWLKGLAFGTTYFVEEDSNEAYETLIKITTYNEGGSSLNTENFLPSELEEKVIKLGTNAVVFENTVKTPLGKLKINKTVVDGELEKDWKFTIILLNPDGTRLDTASSKYPVTKYKGIAGQEDVTEEIAIPGGRLTETLKHGQSLEIGNLPAGTKYIVTEEGANADNYTTTVTGEGIVEETKEIKPDGEETKEIVIGGSGNILKDETSAITFTNAMNTGSLEVSKIVSDPGNNLTNRNKNDQFTFVVELEKASTVNGDLQNVVYVFSKVEGVGEVDVPDERAIAEFKKEADVLRLKVLLKHGQKITLSKIPAGTAYTVTEEDANGNGYYVENVDANGNILTGNVLAGTVIKDSMAKAPFTNKTVTNGLIIDKKVIGDHLTELDTEAVFIFKVELRDRDGGSILTGQYPYRKASSEGYITSGDTVALKHDESIVIEGLPEGAQFAVWEVKTEGADGYTASIQKDEDIKEDHKEGMLIGGTGMISDEKGGEIHFINAIDTGDLSIQKTVTGLANKNDDEFTFEVKLYRKDNQPLTGSYAYIGSSAANEIASPKDGELILDEEGRGTITLKHGQIITISDLPIGTKYSVEEKFHDGYIANTPVNGKGTIQKKDICIKVSFVNIADTGSLSIQKTVTGQKGDKTKRFNFTITLTGKDGQPLTGTYPYTGSVTEEGAEAPPSGSCTFNAKGEAQISLRHGQKVTFTGIPAGASYKVTEAEANQDGYTTKETDAEGTLVKDEEKTARFVNDKPDVPEETTPTEPDTPEETTPTEPSTPEETTPTEPTVPEETTPEESAPPENPTTPSRPSGGGGGRDRDRNPSLTPEPEPIPPEEVPLANINPEDVPLAMMPSESPIDSMVIDDEGVPLFGLPRTGDRGIPAGGLIGMMLLSLMAACGIHVRKREEEE